TQHDLPHTLIADSAVGWLFANRSVDAVLLRGDRICANGDVGAIVGSLGVALLARDAGVPMYVFAPSTAIDRAAPDGSGLAVDLRSAAEALARGSSADLPPNAPSTLFASRLLPRTDIVPARLVSAFLTERGLLGAAAL